MEFELDTSLQSVVEVAWPTHLHQLDAILLVQEDENFVQAAMAYALKVEAVSGLTSL